MTTENKDPKPTDNREVLKPEAKVCSPGYACHASGPVCRVRWIVGAIIILAAGALVARALIKNNSAAAKKATSSFASLPTVEQTPVPLAGAAPATQTTDAVKELDALSDLNAVAADTDGVFVFLPGKNEPLIKAPLVQMRAAARTIEAQGQKIGIFTLKTDSLDYKQLATQMPVPGVLAMVKGRGMIPVSGDITETKLIHGFVAASSGDGCRR